MKVPSMLALAVVFAALATASPAQRVDVLEAMEAERVAKREVIKLASRPIPMTAKSDVGAERRRVVLAFYMRILPEAYESVGRRNEAWDADALSFLKDLAALLSGAAEHADQAALLARAQSLVDRGCDDAAILYGHAALLHNLRRTDEAGPALEKAAAALDASGYPRVLLRYTSMRTARFYWDDAYRKKIQIAAALDTTMRATREMLKNKEYTEAEDRLCFHELFESWDGLFTEYQPQLHKIFDEAALSPWLREMVEGERAIERAWDARGNGWARTVSESAWIEFNKHLALAREHLSAAWGIRQDWIEPATRMIAVAKGQGSNEELRVWFERAVEVEFSNTSPYHAFLDAISFRWLGSLEAMYQFGLACLETKRFDTPVPFMYFNVLREISDEPGSDQSLIRLPRTWKLLQEMFAGYEAESKGYDLVYWKTLHAATAWKHGYYPESARLFEELGTNASRSVVMNYYQRQIVSVRGEVFAMTGPEAEAVRGMIHLSEAGRWTEALAACTSILARVEKESDAAVYLQTHRTGFQEKVDLAQGAAVTLVPDKTFAGWRIRTGSWELLDNGELKGTSNKGMQLLYEQPFTGDFECEVTVVFESSPYKFQHNAGFIFGFANESPDEFQTLLLYRAEQFAVLSHQFNTNEGDSITAPVSEGPNRLTLRVQGGLVSTTLNGQPVHKDVPLAIDRAKSGMRIGIGGKYWYRNAIVRFKDFKVRRLEALK